MFEKLFSKPENELKETPAKNLDFYRSAIWNGKPECIDELSIYSSRLSTFLMDLQRSNFTQEYREPAKDLEKLISKYESNKKQTEELLQKANEFNNSFMSFRISIEGYNADVQRACEKFNADTGDLEKQFSAENAETSEEDYFAEYDTKSAVEKECSLLSNKISDHYKNLIREKCPSCKETVNRMKSISSADKFNLKGTRIGNYIPENNAVGENIYHEMDVTSGRVSRQELQEEIEAVVKDLGELNKSMPKNVTASTMEKIMDISKELGIKKSKYESFIETYDTCVEFNKLVDEYISKEKQLNSIKDSALYSLNSSEDRLLHDLEGNIVFERLHEFGSNYGTAPIKSLFGENLDSFIQKYQAIKEKAAEKEKLERAY